MNSFSNKENESSIRKKDFHRGAKTISRHSTRYDKFPSKSPSRILSSSAISLNLSRSLETRYRVPAQIPPTYYAADQQICRQSFPPASRGSASVRELVIRRDAIKSVEKKVRKDEAARQQGGNNPEDEYAHVTDESSPIYHDETRGDTTTSPRPAINALI